MSEQSFQIEEVNGSPEDIIKIIKQNKLLGNSNTQNVTSSNPRSIPQGTPMSLNTTYSITISTSGEKKYYCFTPSTTGYYIFQSSNNGSSDPRAWLYSPDTQELLEESDDNAGERNFRLIYHLRSGKRYYIEVGCYSGTGSYSMTLTKCTNMSYVAAPSISTSVVVNTSLPYEAKCYSITPSYTSCYRIRSSTSQITDDPCAWLYSSSGTLLKENDDENDESLNFFLEYTLQAGTKYYLVVGVYNSYQTNSYTVNLQALIPQNPYDLTSSIISNNSVALMWNVPTPHYADRFLIQYREKNASSWINAGATWDKKYTVSGLTANRDYAFRVFAEAGYDSWNGLWSQPTNTFTVKAKTLTEQMLQSAFTALGGCVDYDGLAGLQCVDLYYWFIDVYAPSLTPVSANGKDCASVFAEKNNLPTRTTPTAFSVFSVAAGVDDFGSDGNAYGHTGIVVSVNQNDGTCTVVHTGGSLCNDPDKRAWISTYSYEELADDGELTFVDVSEYLYVLPES